MDNSKIIRKCPTFADLPEAFYQRWSEKFKVQHYPDGAVIYKIGAKLRYLYIVIEGQVRFDYVMPDGSEMVIYMTDSCRSLGEVELTNNFGAIASATAVGHCKMLQVSKADYQEMVKTEPLFGWNVCQLLSNHVRYSVEAANFHYERDIESRLAKLLIQLESRLNVISQDDGSCTLPISLTHDDLANMMVTTRQTISRLMKRWKEKGWLDYKYGRITFKDMPSLLAHVSKT